MTRAAQAGLQQAVSSLAAMNEAIPLEQRQQAIALAGDMDRKAAAARASEMGAADLGNPQTAQIAAANPPAPIAQVPLPPAREAPPMMAAQSSEAPHAAPAARPTRIAVHPQPAMAAGGSWRVQLGAFGQKSNADALWAKLRNRPEIAGHPRSDVGTGVARLTATGYSLEAAQHACTTLKAAGLTCIVVNH